LITVRHLLSCIKPKVLLVLLLIACVSEAKALTEEQLIDVYSHAYSASGKLSKGDFRMIAKFELLQADWNAALTPMVKGLRDPGMVPEEWARSARRYLNEAEMIKVKMGIAAAQVEDSSARSSVKQIADINSQMFVAWEDVRQAMANSDNDAYRRAGTRAQGLAQEKANVAGPIIRRLREKLGDRVIDGALERELRELARKVGM
jgi:hypothetical protein